MKATRALLLAAAPLVALALCWSWLQEMSPEARERAARLRAPHTEISIEGWPRDSMYFLIDGCRLDYLLPAGLTARTELLSYVEVDGSPGCEHDQPTAAAAHADRTGRTGRGAPAVGAPVAALSRYSPIWPTPPLLVTKPRVLAAAEYTNHWS